MKIKHLLIAGATAAAMTLAGQAAYAGAVPGAGTAVEQQAGTQGAVTLVQIYHHHGHGGAPVWGFGGPYYWGGPYFWGCSPFDAYCSYGAYYGGARWHRSPHGHHHHAR